MAVGTTGVLAFLGGVLLCQFAVLNHLTQKSGIVSTLRAGTILILILAGVLIWIAGGPWIGASAAVLLMINLIIVFQSFINYQLEWWTEPSHFE
jgi:hypothetical protein